MALFAPSEYGKVSTVHEKFMKWIHNGKIKKLFELIRNEYLIKSDAFNNWYAVDTSHSKAPYTKYSGKSPTDRGKRGIKKNLIIDSRGAPLAIGVAPTNKHDSQMLLEILESIKSIRRANLSIIAADSDSNQLRKIAAKDRFILINVTTKIVL